MANSEQQLREAFTLMKDGKTNEAGRIVQGVIREDKDNVRAWWMLANLVDDPNRKKKATEKVLALDPTHLGAVKLMAELDPSYIPPSKVDLQRRAKKVRETQSVKAVDGEYDFSKLGETDPALEVEQEPDRSDLRVAQLAMSAIGILIVAVIGVVLFLEIQNGNISFFNSRSPEETVDEYFAALANFDFDTLADLTCGADQDDVVAAAQQLNEQLSAGGTDLSEMSVDVSGLTTTLTEQTEERFLLEVGGQLRFSFQDFTLPIDVDDLGEGTVGEDGFVVRESGEWLVCTQ